MERPLEGKRIGLLAGWASRQNGGVFEALVAHIALLRSLGAQPHVFAAADEFSTGDNARLAGAVTHFAPCLGPAALAYAPDLAKTMQEARLDCLHAHGIWQGHSRLGAQWAKANGGRYIISPHGMLDPWITGRGRLKKALFRQIVEKANWRSAQLFHALTEAEADDICREVPGARVEIVPNAAPSVGWVHAGPRRPEIAYIGRIHAKKNLGALIEGWKLAEPRLPADAQLTIAGIGADADIAKLQSHVAKAGERVSFVGPAYGETKREILQSARFLVLPSLSEGLPVAMLDAWAAGTPTLMSEACHLPQGFEAGAALDCGTAPEEIAAAIEAALTIRHERWQAMSDAAIALASGPFSSQDVASRWENLYARVMQDGRHDG